MLMLQKFGVFVSASSPRAVLQPVSTGIAPVVYHQSPRRNVRHSTSPSWHLCLGVLRHNLLCPGGRKGSFRLFVGGGITAGWLPCRVLQPDPASCLLFFLVCEVVCVCREWGVAGQSELSIPLLTMTAYCPCGVQFRRRPNRLHTPPFLTAWCSPPFLGWKGCSLLLSSQDRKPCCSSPNASLVPRPCHAG